MKETNNKLIAIYYSIYALFVIGIVIAHLLNYQFMKLYGTRALVAEYIELGVMLVAIPTAMVLYNHKIKRQVSLEYYFKWNVIQMSIIAFAGIVAIVVYALLPIYRVDVTAPVDQGNLGSIKNLFPFLIIFIALIMCKPTKYKIQKYFQEKED